MIKGVEEWREGSTLTACTIIMAEKESRHFV